MVYCYCDVSCCSQNFSADIGKRVASGRVFYCTFQPGHTGDKRFLSIDISSLKAFGDGFHLSFNITTAKEFVAVTREHYGK